MSPLKNITHKGLFAILLACSTTVFAQTRPASEYGIKAVFILNFTQFVEWPASSFASPQTPLVIGVLGGNPFGGYLENAVAGEKAKGRPLVVNYYKNPEEIKACHILFINKSQINDMGNILSKLNGTNTLTISDAAGFLQNGGMFRFVNKNNKINIQVNLDAAKAAKLDVSSKLLRLCDIYAP